jgi:hypothetical protein
MADMTKDSECNTDIDAATREHDVDRLQASAEAPERRTERAIVVAT